MFVERGLIVLCGQYLLDGCCGSSCLVGVLLFCDGDLVAVSVFVLMLGLFSLMGLLLGSR
ncbi:hypothetical protein [Kitasatospora cathayae]|uniref:Transmembrane protein n=1 Tax=Kitasatospora cathayae TaxID=3004092 RepID=A0ABY7QH89_9ACTN|nr:hypothetical protein [Kitasatospora sp. HUAS 3-15]WBP92173.1 hypothetical protein O1G21_41240 [Kitasatospora sp. HUAS 3-15]